MPRDDAALIDILKAARLVQEFVAGYDRPRFMADTKTQSAVLLQLLIVGEAVKRPSQGFRQQHPAVPWTQIAGMRDVLIHHYDHVDLDEVWKTVTADIQSLVDYVVPLTPRQGA
jgi:uncharacterized protein with HEPN domain